MRQIRTLAVLSLALCAAACAKPPQEQIAEAQAALEAAARSTDVVTYAPDSLRAAQETLGALEVELAAQSRRAALTRSYDAATQLALQVLAESRTAVRDAAGAKEQVRAAAGPLIASTLEAAAEVEKRLWAARRVRGVRPAFLAARADDIAQARAGLADAQKDFDAGSFAAAKAKAMAVRNGLDTIDGRISEAVRLARN
jgi:hypothetical protein